MRLVWTLALVTGCVSRGAGYDDVRTLVSERAGADLRWNAVDDPDTEKRTRELLGAPLSAKNAVAVALLNNREIQADLEDLGVARAGLVKALALPNPHVDMGVHFLGEREPQFDIEVMLEISQLIFMPLRHDAADAEMEAAKLAVAGRVLDLVLAVRRAFYDLQAAEQTLTLQRTSAAASRAAWEAAAQLQEAGNVTDLEAATEHAQYEESRLTVARAELQVAVAREQLGERMGLWGAVAWSIAGPVAKLPASDPPLRDLERQALRRSLDLRIAAQRHGAAAQRADVASADGWLPGVALGVEVEREEEGWEIGPELELEVPLFYQGQGEVAAAESDMRREKERHAGLAVRIRAASRAAAARLLEARARATFYEEVLLPLRARVMQETELQHNAMAVSVFQLLRAKREQIETERTYVESLRDYWVARAEVELLLAGRLVRVTTPTEPDGGPPSDGEGH